MSLRCALAVIVLIVPVPGLAQERASAVFAGGCFWCMEPPFDELDGVLDTTSGYTGGHTASPTYKQVTAGNSGHYESVRVTYDPNRVSYEQLLAVYWVNVDPFDATGQFCDKGSSYRSAVFVADEIQRKLAESSKRANEASFDRGIVTEILPAGEFYPAEDYHQDYYEKNPLRYKYYRYGCRRDQRLEVVWGGR